MTEIQSNTIARPPLEGVRIISVEQFGAGPWGNDDARRLGGRDPQKSKILKQAET